MGRRMNMADVPHGAANPLEAAVSGRDRSTIAMVEEAIAHNQTRLAFQPVIQARAQGTIAFYEGLIRVLDETGRVIPAKDFMPVVEDNELGRKIDCAALAMGLKALRRAPELRLSINMSARSIGFKPWMRVLQRGLTKDASVGPRLILEITESSAMQVPELVASFMEELQSAGISFALDDFGAGHTAFRYFRQFYFDLVKIDGQFVRGIANDPDNQVLTRALAAIAQQFDMFTVAENVETPEDAAVLTDMGIDCLQGYLFGAPSIRPPWLPEMQERASA